MIKLFTAATVTPVDSGCSGDKGLAGLQTSRKVHPIACAEVLAKLGEGTDIANG